MSWTDREEILHGTLRRDPPHRAEARTGVPGRVSVSGWLATVLGLGLSPIAPGLLGSAAGLALAVALLHLPIGRRLVVIAGIALVAVPLTDRAARDFATSDDQRIVLDEAVAMPLAALPAAAPSRALLLGTAFVAFRVFDAAKPPPVDLAESVPGGTGIVLDDLVAGLYALLATWLVRVIHTRPRDQDGGGCSTTERTGA